MTKEQRKEIRTRIISSIDEMMIEESNKDASVEIGGHTISRRLLYAGGSQWAACDRAWDSTESGWAWVVDEQYHLTTPDLFGFDGHNIIERQTPYYLQDEQTTPEHDGRDGIGRVPNRVLIEIAKGLVEATKAAKEREEAEAAEATKLLEALG